MTRNLDALHRYLADRGPMPFAWGHRRNDCVSFAIGAARAQTGRNPLASLGRIRWTTERGARRVLNRLGGVAAAVDAVLPAIAPAFAERGDIAGVEDPALGLLLMVVDGETLVGPGARGIRHLPRDRMVRAWRVSQ